jgi:SAM-dependent methyltransferase
VEPDVNRDHPAADFREATLARFAAHRRAWDENEAVRFLYARWYGRVREQLPAEGPWVEIGSGPGFARDFIPGLQLTDVVQAPWHDRQVDAGALPFGDASLGALVLFDVLHHLPAPARFFAEAERVLRRGGRLVLCEPYVSPLSFPVYRFFHEERLDLRADPLAEVPAGDPFDANQAIPTLLLERRPDELARRFPSLRLVRFERLSGPAYPASGGFSRAPLLPLPLWRALLALEDRLPAGAFRLLGFRLLAVLERA